MDLVDVLDSISVYPNHWNYVEEFSTLAEKLDICENCCVDLGKEVLNDRVVSLKGFCITLP